jgi:hypothetical protein
MTSEERYPTINGNKYYVKVVETSRKKRVTVYNKDKHSKFYKGGSQKNYIVNNVKKKSRLWHFGKDTTPPLEEMIQETLNEAVCIREDKEEEKDRLEHKIERAISNVEEVHES